MQYQYEVTVTGGTGDNPWESQFIKTTETQTVLEVEEEIVSHLLANGIDAEVVVVNLIN